jgi:putative ATPase
VNPCSEEQGESDRLQMKEMGYGSGYQYDPDTPFGFSGQDYFPEELERKTFYQPVERGFEREMKKRIDYFNKLRDRIKNNPD